MCGLAGWFDLGPASPAPSPERQRAALDALIDRGPDAEGTFVAADGAAGLLHRRLSVVDVEGGVQPWLGPRPGDVLAWNGELFDHRALHDDLAARGNRLTSRSDTEVLAHLLTDQGKDVLAGLRSQYALAWITGLDAHGGAPRQLLLARDPAGEKPLYWCESGSRIWFASTLDALLALADPPRDLDPEALSLYLSWGFVPAPLSIFRGVRKLRAGEWLVADRECGVSLGHVDPWPTAQAPPPGEELDAFRDVLARASRTRLESADVPVGVFLSGGLDSLAVAAVLRDAPSLRTFTVRSRDPATDESAAAAEVASALGIAHEILDPPADDAEGWRVAMRRHGEPFGTAAVAAVDAVAAGAGRHVKVALTGDGGDEALGGYPRHLLLRRLARFPRLPVRVSTGSPSRLRRVRRTAELLSMSAAERYAAMYEICGAWRARLLPDDPGATAQNRIRDLWDGAAAGDLRAMLRVDRALELPDSHCVKVDVACMGNGVESRSPFLDREVVALCDALPADWRLRGRTTKFVIRRLIERELPADVAARVLGRKKRGFATGFDSALRAPGTRDLLLGGVLRRVPGLELGVVEELFGEHVDGRGNHIFRLGVLVGLAVFADAHL